MKKVFSYVSLFLCAFMLCGNLLTVNAAETYDVYETGEKITKEMTSGKKVRFTVVEDEGKNSQYVKVIANPADLSQFDVTTAYSYNDLSAEGWTDKIINLTNKLGTLWGQSGTVQIKENDNYYKIALLGKQSYDDFVNKYATAKYGNGYDALDETNQNKVTEDIKTIFNGQNFWVVNQNEDGATFAYDRIVNGAYVNTEMDDTAKTEAMNVTVTAVICKTPKQKPNNPNTADNNVLILTIIGAGCIICIVTIGRKMLA